MRKFSLFIIFLCFWTDVLRADVKPDPAKGYSYLVNGGYVGCGIPVTVMKRAVASKSLIPPQVISIFVPMAADSIFTSWIRLPGRNADNAMITPSMNVFTSKRGVKAMNYNCLACHGEYLDGQFIVGLGNRSRDYTQDIRLMASLLPFLAWSPGERAEVKAFRRAADTVGPYIKTKTVGVNPAINLTYALFAQRNASDFSWSETKTLEPPSTDFPPVDVPPWWRMGRKTSMFYNGEFQDHHHRIMSLASTLCVESKEEMQAIEKPFRDVEAYIRSIKPPVYPRPIDQDLALVGKGIFQENCSSCHGSYGVNAFYPELMIPVDLIGTDPMLMEQQTGPEHERFRNWGEEAALAIYGEGFAAAGQRAYLAPPLDGIWATAPFFHNGSVPSLEGVLDSSKRPKYWWKEGTEGAQDYDSVQIAVRHRPLTYGQAQGSPLMRRYIYDTTVQGYGNQGHDFGDHLSDDERRAVIEYLKTL